MNDPAVAPDPSLWLELSDEDRLGGVLAWHAVNPNPVIHAREPGEHHCRLHVTIETQIAVGEPAAVARNVGRLTELGLQRHVAIHAIIEVFVRRMHAVLLEQRSFDEGAYAAALNALDASEIVARRL